MGSFRNTTTRYARPTLPPRWPRYCCPESKDFLLGLVGAVAAAAPAPAVVYVAGAAVVFSRIAPFCLTNATNYVAGKTKTPKKTLQLKPTT